MSEPLQVVAAFGSLESRRYLATILVNLGIDPICISSLAQCRELLSKEDIDLIFCDRFLSDGGPLVGLSGRQEPTSRRVGLSP
jgi:hypothetical protein